MKLNDTSFCNIFIKFRQTGDLRILTKANNECSNMEIQRRARPDASMWMRHRNYDLTKKVSCLNCFSTLLKVMGPITSSNIKITVY